MFTYLPSPLIKMSTVPRHVLFSFHLHLGQSLTYFTQHKQPVMDCIATADTHYKVILPVQLHKQQSLEMISRKHDTS